MTAGESGGSMQWFHFFNGIFLGQWYPEGFHAKSMVLKRFARDVKDPSPAPPLSAKTTIQSRPTVPDLTLPDCSLSRTIFQDLCEQHRNPPHSPEYWGFSDRMQIPISLTPVHIESIFSVPDFLLLLG